MKAASASTSSRANTWCVFVRYRDPSTTEEDLVAFLSDSNISVQSCTQLVPREDWHKHYATFRVVVDYAHKDDIFDKVPWPPGTDVRIWIFKSRKHDGEQT